MKRFGEFVLRWRVVVVLLWLGVAGALNLLVPQLETVATERSTPMVPADAQGMKVLAELGEQFHEPSANGLAYLVVRRGTGLTDQDRRYHDAVLAEVGADREHVAAVQNLWSNPDTAASAVSPDGTTAYTMIRLSADTGATAATNAISSIRSDLTAVPRPPGLEAEVAGLGATVADELDGVHTSLQLITGVTVLLIALLLFAVYRSIAVAAVPLLTIGLGLGVARPVVALMGLHGSPISIFSLALLAALILGAGTDYAIFLISRYHEERRAGLDDRAAMVSACSRISTVILASALVVAVTSASMSVAEIGMFRSIGLPCAVGILVVAAAAVTLTPATLALVSERGWAEPRPHSATDWWRGVANAAVKRPVRTLAGSLVLLVILALIVPTIVIAYDERSTIGDDTDSNRGYQLAAQSFGANELLPITMLVRSDADLRTSAGFASLERISAAVAGVDGVESVRGVTRPMGRPLTEAAVGYQAGVVGDRLDAAVVQLARSDPQVRQLGSGMTKVVDGSRQLRDGTDRLATGTRAARNGSQRLVDGSEQLSTGLTRLSDGADQLAEGSRQVGRGAALLKRRADDATAPLLPATDAVRSLRGLVDADPQCATNPMCSAARTLLVAVERSPVGDVEQLRSGVDQLAEGNARLQSGLTTLTTEMNRAVEGARQLRNGQVALNSGLVTLDDGAVAARTGARRLADGVGPLAGGVTQLTSGVTDMQRGLRQAADYLGELRDNAGSPTEGGGFYLPASALASPRLAPAISLFIAPDGKSARMQIVTTGDAFSEKADQQAQQIRTVAQQAADDSGLPAARTALTGPSIMYFELGDFAFRDLLLIALTASILIVVILAFMLRSIVIPAYILASVILSYLAAIGVSVLLWQHLLHIPLHWAVPSMSFIALAAVGADYNLLLMSRVREEARDHPGGGTRAAVIRAVTGTGGVITVAAVIFAITMMALLISSVTNVGQIGFTIAVGLLIDAMIVRTLTIPSLAALLGRWNWWPSRPPDEAAIPGRGEAADGSGGPGDPAPGEPAQAGPARASTESSTSSVSTAEERASP
ncbi:MMPL family transporter [Gordonia soli]|uniref:Membrane transport protein MMPL domain-containing protein n=1 Tax=Gordonia soli NBRC 108243 TaxID=1223545 RepID=M0QKD7_9ACTN|nr:MMPL family transporter [Gordonia soli]GAC67872.1 hypothetical protein GS4_11_01410 [Gordonia soli NBRC 108243]